MDPLSVISEAFSQTSSLLGGLLAQMGSRDAGNSLFSSFLSPGGGDPSSAAQPLPLATAINTASSTATSPTTDSSGLLQALENVSSTMRKALGVLRQQNEAAPSGTNYQSADRSHAGGGGATAAQAAAQETKAPDSATSVRGGVQENNQAAASPPASSAPGPSSAPAFGSPSSGGSTPESPPSFVADLQKLASLIAQLLALIQLMVKTLQHEKPSDGASAKASLVVETIDVASPHAGSGGADRNVKALRDVLAVPAAPAKTGVAAVDPSPANDLGQLLTDLQKIMQPLLPPQIGTAKAPVSPRSGQETAVALLASTPDIASEMAALDAKLKDFIAAMQAQDKASVSPRSGQETAVALRASTPGAAAQMVALDTKLKDSIAAPQAQDKAPVAVRTSGDTPSPPTPTAAAESALAPSPQAPPPAQGASSKASPPTAAQIFANGAALAAAADHNSGSANTDSGSGFLPDNQAAASRISFGAAAATVEGAQATGTYTFASTLSALRAMNGGSIGLPSVVDQVILQMNRSVKSGNDQMTVQLNPADLGKITVKLSFGVDGKVQGSVTADNPQTLNLLQADSRSLERALQDAGLHADPGSLKFSLGGGEGGGHHAGQTANNGGNPGAATGDGTVSAADSARGVAMLIDTSAETYYLTPGGVNIKV